MPELKPVYLIVGTDRPKVGRALERLRARVGEESVQVLGAREASGGDVAAECNALGLFGGGQRLVLVQEAERWKAADVKALEAYLAAPAPDTVVALTGEVKPDSALAKLCAKHGDVLRYDVSKRDLPGWVAEQFARHGARADAAACAALVELVGDDLDDLASEADKLATWAAGEPIEARHVQDLAAGRADTSVFALTDAWGRRDVAGALRACEELLERSNKARRDEVPRLAALLGNHVGRVRACQALAADGVRPRDAAGTLKMHPFSAEKAFAQARNFTLDDLRDAVVRLAELDVALKGGSRLAPDLELQRAIVDVTAPRESAV
ncbi:MAG TPA: DNA polymerase III subunit delta [Gaiellaceae bacterium]|nr:DNA polymerase III subunit delta [Gaiellaceae bacterium]